jgi:hypothetical protein
VLGESENDPDLYPAAGHAALPGTAWLHFQIIQGGASYRVYVGS